MLKQSKVRTFTSEHFLVVIVHQENLFVKAFFAFFGIESLFYFPRKESKKMKINYIRVPNCIIENSEWNNDNFTVALYLYSLQDKDNGYDIKVKQSKIAEMCGGIKVQSVQNAFDALDEAWLIDYSKKTNKDDSLYTYYLVCEPDEDCPKIPIKAVQSIILTQHLDNYNINNRLKSNLLHLYAFCVMLAGNNSKLNISYDDISEATDLTRGRVIEWLEILCIMGLLRKGNNNSKSKERTENVYYIN